MVGYLLVTESTGYHAGDLLLAGCQHGTGRIQGKAQSTAMPLPLVATTQRVPSTSTMRSDQLGPLTLASGAAAGASLRGWAVPASAHPPRRRATAIPMTAPSRATLCTVLLISTAPCR